MNFQFILKELQYIITQILDVIFHPITLCFALIVGIVFFMIVKCYKRTTYYEITKTPFFVLINDIGKLGEYMIYRDLRVFEKAGAKFLFNIYVPKENNETTEIDVLMLCRKGIFVFESKNYSGWIFGNENQYKWTQTLPQGKKSHKESFFNPIMQNQAHIKHLKTLLTDEITMHSIIVFSNRCTFKNLTVTNKDIKVINRFLVENTVSDILNNITEDNLSPEKITDIYNTLYPLTQVDERLKEVHIENIQYILKIYRKKR